MVTWRLAVALPALALAACTTVEYPETPTVTPDRVVGIELKCDLVQFSDDQRRVEFAGDFCKRWSGGQVNDTFGEYNLRQELTIRTGAGHTYKVPYDAGAVVNLGDTWTTMTERPDTLHVARMLGVTEVRVRRELASAVRRSEPDAREVYGMIEGVRFVGRRERLGAPSWISLERRLQPWERHPLTGWSG